MGWGGRGGSEYSIGCSDGDDARLDKTWRLALILANAANSTEASSKIQTNSGVSFPGSAGEELKPLRYGGSLTCSPLINAGAALASLFCRWNSQFDRF